MSTRTVWFADSETGKRRKGVKRYSEAQPGSPRNPDSINGISADDLIDRNTMLRADDLPLIAGSNRNRRTDTLPSLQSDRHLRIVIASKRVTLAVVRRDRIASPQTAPDVLTDLPGSTQLSRKRVRTDSPATYTNAGQTVVTDTLAQP